MRRRYHYPPHVSLESLMLLAQLWIQILSFTFRSINTQCVLPLVQCFQTLLHAGNLTYEEVYRPENREEIAGL